MGYQIRKAPDSGGGAFAQFRSKPQATGIIGKPRRMFAQSHSLRMTGDTEQAGLFGLSNQ